MKKSNKTFVAKLLAMTLVCATALCACEEEVSTNENGNSTQQGGGVSGTMELTITANGVSFKMIKVEGGTFTMGATPEQGEDAYENEYPAHQVTLSDYYIGETEVTQELWQSVMGDNPSYGIENSNNPVTMVSWFDCQEFINKLNELTGKNFRFPTEAEWEFAARGGNRSKGYKYAGSNTVDEIAWYDLNSDSTTNPVAQKQPNELGLYDMSGNVREWCSDFYGAYSGSPQTNPGGATPPGCPVLRGGSWESGAGGVRVSFRDMGSAGRRDYIDGLRLAMDK